MLFHCSPLVEQWNLSADPCEAYKNGELKNKEKKTTLYWPNPLYLVFKSSKSKVSSGFNARDWFPFIRQNEPPLERKKASDRRSLASCALDVACVPTRAFRDRTFLGFQWLRKCRSPGEATETCWSFFGRAILLEFENMESHSKRVQAKCHLLDPESLRDELTLLPLSARFMPDLSLCVTATWKITQDTH